jgi:isoleucyl-tRNA synthetase
MVAPVLSFTADEVWGFIPGEREASVHVASFPVPHPEWKDEALVERWERIIKVRGEVSKALEQARVAKVIGHSLDAAVAISAPAELLSFLRDYAAELKSIFIVSKVDLDTAIKPDECYKSDNVEGLEILVTAAPGAKCERCWCYDEEIGKDSEHPTICPKCLKAVK